MMVIDGAKGVESQTRKLFEVCRLRDLPILTFCNKMDRESRDTFEIIDEIQENLAIDVSPASWPIGVGREFVGCYDILHDRLELMDRADRNRVAESVKIDGLDDPKLAALVAPELLKTLREELEMARELLPAFDHGAFLNGSMTPIWFGSAINSFGVKELMAGIGAYGPAPQVQRSETREVAPEELAVTGFVFKVQANMDPKHRDRVAFVRLASGHFLRGMKLVHVRTKKPMAVTNPVLFLAADRELAEEAWAGDIMGIPNHGQLRIGDALTEGEALRFTGIPSFAPELLQGVRAGDPMKAKHLEKALMQFAEEGAAKVFKPMIGSGFIVGVVGALQFDVLASRIEQEYQLPVRFEGSQFTSARWVTGPKAEVERFINVNKGHIAVDHDGDTVYLTRLKWDIDRIERDYPDADAGRDEGHDGVTLQNRVMPDGRIVAVAARGTLTGNRGILHDADKRLGTARWRHPHWISCTLDYKGLRRTLMTPGRWTELFFLDEAVALAAGHRPCALCRRPDYLRFSAAWAAAFGQRQAAPAIDAVLHGARLRPGTRLNATHEAPGASLPAGTFIAHDGGSALVYGDRLLPFAPAGYGPPVKRPDGLVTVLTPRPLVAVLAAGYRPRLHPSAGEIRRVSRPS